MVLRGGGLLPSCFAAARGAAVAKPAYVISRRDSSNVRLRFLSRGGLMGMWDSLRGQKLIGKDKYGNTYWEFNDPKGNPPIKREVHYAEKRMVMSSP